MRSGLDGIIAAETALSHSDGAKGELWVRGVTIEELVARHGYEGAVALLWEAFAAERPTREAMRAALGAGREQAYARLDDWLPFCRPGAALGEDLRRALAALPEDSAPAAILASLPVAIAALLRRRRGETPIAPDPALGTAADFLRMAQGSPPTGEAAAALDTYWTAVIDNGLNSSSFTARIVVSTRASLVACVLGAYCAFGGKLHGGAPGPTLDMLDEAASSGDLAAWAEAKLAAGERLMGFGHRVFKDGDPRALVLRRALERLAPGLAPGAGRLAFAAEVERAVAAAFARVKPGRPPLRPNVEIAAALLLDAVGLPREAFMPVFAVARCAGWLAHAQEQRATGRLIRPSSAYIGPRPGPA